MDLSFVPLVALLSAVYIVVNWFKYLTNRQWREAFTQIVVWAVGIGAAFLAANADVLRHTVISGVNVQLGSLDGWSLVLLGTIIGSVGSTFDKTLKSVDNGQTSAMPALIPPAGKQKAA